MVASWFVIIKSKLGSPLHYLSHAPGQKQFKMNGKHGWFGWGELLSEKKHPTFGKVLEHVWITTSKRNAFSARFVRIIGSHILHFDITKVTKMCSFQFEVACAVTFFWTAAVFTTGVHVSSARHRRSTYILRMDAYQYYGKSKLATRTHERNGEHIFSCGFDYPKLQFAECQKFNVC